MKGYTQQYADFNVYMDTSGKRIDRDELASKLENHTHGDEIMQLVNASYRTESLHNNGDIHDEYNPESLNLARVTHEVKAVSTADLEAQASNKFTLWDSLSDSYTAYVKNTQRWKNGYKPDAIKPDARFMRRVNETKLRMKKNRRYAGKLAARYNELFGA